jgi:metallophosphoesterase (TIGR00282 family)
LVAASPNATGMRVLFFGDVTGPRAVAALADRLPRWRKAYRIDAVIANAENAVVSRTDDPRLGFGMDTHAVATLLQAGVDVITGGNHSWDTPDADDALDSARVLRPHNVFGALAGKGVTELKTDRGALTVINMMGASAAGERYTVSNPLAAFDALALPDAPVIVDFHSESVTEKQTFAHAVDGRAAAVLGTHTHEPSALLHRLPKGTLFAADVGMVGPDDGVQGVAPEFYVREMRDFKEPHHFDLAAGPLLLGAVLLEIGRGADSTIERFTPPDWNKEAPS